MSAKDKIHQAVKNALIKDGWTITHDPFTIKYEDFRVAVDLGIERVIAVERGSEKLAIEVKSFVGQSIVNDIENALGQFVVYMSFLEELEPDRPVYVAISQNSYDTVFQKRAVQHLIRRNRVPLVVVNIITEEVVEWIPN